MSPASQHLDLVVVGSGVAGLSAAVRAADHGLRVGVVTKGRLEQATTRWAQGGIAAVLRGDPDSTDLHLADTLAAGDGLCDETAVRVLVDEGPGRVLDLIARGAVFDRDDAGDLDLTVEGGHSAARVVHAGGVATGIEIERALVEAVGSTAAVLLEQWFAVDLLVEGGECVGVVAVDGGGESRSLTADNVLLAAGGSGQLYAVTTNPTEATGDGLAMALRAGAAVADVEFMQFHPTALHHPRMPRPLLSEALRGHGALLRDHDGERFVDELTPRDVVSLAMARRMHEAGVKHLWLDATGLEGFRTRFPTVSAQLAEVGLDPTTDWLPIAPAAHYHCGGVLTDLDGATTLPGLWAAGEVACTGVHGANRLASNSLLDGMVFGARVVEAVAAGRRAAGATGPMRSLTGTSPDGIGVRRLALTVPEPGVDGDPSAGREELQQVMTRCAGVLRSGESLAEASVTVAGLSGRFGGASTDPDRAEVANLFLVAAALVAAAVERTESRGAHTRDDHPTSDGDQRQRLVLTVGTG
tara:strand:+ start:7311 stop:8891 length:1581 start_codon:yes stop_codon:yes gene_type:complete